ncbi:DUF4185 domain-containing protein [Pedobacter deserti]|uniref:DUF4185 domain-containing protein n=1 Tax=Pedobacter deserti TaxID=2817382 RepID=UPI00210C529D|nr:DUF4185 domain-containing protein [Pedobacter sp. SYSU D00382]
MKPNIVKLSLAFLLAAPLFSAAQQLGNLKNVLKPVNVIRVARLTGNSLPGEDLPNANETVKKYDIGGTDLGIAWRMGNGKTGFWFGDTYGADWKPTPEGGPGPAGHWRSNVVGISTDEHLGDGVTFDHMVAKEIIPSPHITDGTGNHTTIPTAAIHANGKDYVHYMEVRKWGPPGTWTTNKSGLYKSADNALTWTECKTVEFSGSSNFAQAAYEKKDGYVYMMGTVSGRQGAIHLSRVKERDMEDKSAYDYWNGVKWLRNQETSATPIIPAPAGELSLAWHQRYKRWVVVYLDEKRHELVLRSAASITGPWTEAQSLVKSADYPALYGGFIHPSSTNGSELYFLMSMWHPYNVFLMKADLKLE